MSSRHIFRLYAVLLVINGSDKSSQCFHYFADRITYKSLKVSHLTCHTVLYFLGFVVPLGSQERWWPHVVLALVWVSQFWIYIGNLWLFIAPLPLFSLSETGRRQKSCHIAFNEQIYVFLLVLLKLINVTLRWFQVGLILSCLISKTECSGKEKHYRPGVLVDWVRITAVSYCISYLQYFISRQSHGQQFWWLAPYV